MDKVEEMFTDTRGIIVDLSDQRLMTVSHPPRWISVLNFVFCGTLFVSFPPYTEREQYSRGMTQLDHRSNRLPIVHDQFAS
jgi:hypothetical protein